MTGPEHDPAERGAPAATAGLGARLAGALIAGAILGLGVEVVIGFGLAALARVPALASGATLFRSWLAGGAWLVFPLWGAALGALGCLRAARSARARGGLVALAAALALLPVVAPARLPVEGGERGPRGPRAKALAILKWSYRSPAGVERILALASDLDPEVREQAVLALGENLIVSDVEHATPERPPRFAASPLRARLRDQLLASMRDDSAASVRAEAARALWKAPVTFGPQPAAAETLAALLSRALAPGVPERFAWLALDAAAGRPDSGLKAAAARFAAQVPDSDLARAARRASR